MKKYILVGITFTFLSIILIINVSVNNNAGSFELNINENVEATMHAVDYALHEANCPNGGTYKRCEPANGERCDIHAQTVC